MQGGGTCAHWHGQHPQLKGLPEQFIVSLQPGHQPHARTKTLQGLHASVHIGNTRILQLLVDHGHLRKDTFLQLHVRS